jgi:hypothetical protein
LLAYPELVVRNRVQWYVPCLDVNQDFWCLLVVTDRDGELDRLGAERAEALSQLEDDGEWRVELCADDRSRVMPLCIRWILARRVCELLDLLAQSLEMYENAIFVIHFE